MNPRLMNTPENQQLVTGWLNLCAGDTFPAGFRSAVQDPESARIQGASSRSISLQSARQEVRGLGPSGPLERPRLPDHRLEASCEDEPAPEASLRVRHTASALALSGRSRPSHRGRFGAVGYPAFDQFARGSPRNER